MDSELKLESVCYHMQTGFKWGYRRGTAFTGEDWDLDWTAWSLN